MRPGDSDLRFHERTGRLAVGDPENPESGLSVSCDIIVCRPIV